jgi:hypothetical protein
MTAQFSKDPVWQRWLLLGLILLAFGRVTLRLDAKNFWWDESLSLQRAEEGWGALLRGELWLTDGFTQVLTIDQHPYFSFLLQGVLVRLAGAEETVLRFPAAMAATLLTPALWVFARRLAHQGAAPPGAPLWAAFLAAINPFYLWYGQEARPYALWALLAVASTYLLMRCLAQPSIRMGSLLGYVLALVAFLSTHYLGVFLLPLHALLVLQYFARRNLRQALLGAGAIGLVALLAAGVALWQLIRPGAGDNLDRITARILIPDLLNAFSMGKSVNINDVWWLDLLFAAVALLGLGWGLRCRKSAANAGWVLPLFVLTPVIILLLINIVRPAYMDARHQSLVSGGFLLLVAAGLGVLAQWRLWRPLSAALPVAALFLGGAGYSTVNYFTLPAYDKDHYTEMGQYIQEHLLPGDVLLLNPPSSWRIFRYYLPLEAIDAAIARGVDIAYAGMPLLRQPWEETYARLETYRGQYRRIWHANSGTHPYFDPNNQVESWLNDNAIQFKRERFFSPNSVVALDLYLPGAPVYEGDAADLPIQHRIDARFGDQIHLIGYDIGEPLGQDFPLPVTLYWQVPTKPEQRYKYILRLVEPQPGGEVRELAATEREPYDGVAPTIYWDPGKTIIEYSNLPPTTLAGGVHQLVVQMYNADTLEKLSVRLDRGEGAVADPQTLVLPFSQR